MKCLPQIRMIFRNDIQVVQPQNTQVSAEPTKFCKFCGAKIHMDAVMCTSCGRQVEVLAQQNSQPQIVINNSNNNVNTNDNSNNTGAAPLGMKAKKKWVSFFLCLFLGYFGAHKFYEGKIGMGVVYLLTGGLFFIGWIIDCIRLLFKTDPYYV